MAIIGKAQITLSKSDPKPMWFAWSSSETVFAPKENASLWMFSSAFMFFGGKPLGDYADWITDWAKVAEARTDTYKYLWCKLEEKGEPFLFSGYTGETGEKGDDGLSITTTAEYLLDSSASLTEAEQAAKTGWVEEELVTWSYGKYLYKRLKKTIVETGAVSYTYTGRAAAVEDYFKTQLYFSLSTDRPTYIVNKRSNGTQTITLRIDQRYYNPTSYTWTKNGEAFTPTQNENNSALYTFEISVTADPVVLEIAVVPYIDGTAIEGVSSSVIISPDNQTAYYQFFGLLSSLPGTTGYIAGDSFFYSAENAIYVFDGRQWMSLSSSSLSDSVKMQILAKAEKTAFEYAEKNGLSNDYGYFDVLFAKYVYARNIGAETIWLQKKDDNTGKIVGGDYTTEDADGYLVNQGVYIDADGVAKFTKALLNDCHIKGGTIEVLSVEGELINDVLSTKQTADVGEPIAVGMMSDQNYYLGSQAKAGINTHISADNTIYDYTGQYAGKSFAKIVRRTSNMPENMSNYIAVAKSFTISSPLSSYSYVWGNGRVLAYDSYASMKVTTDGSSWTDVSTPIYNSSRSASFGVGYGLGKFWAYTNGPSSASSYQKLYSSADGITWTQVGTITTTANDHTFAYISFFTAGSALFIVAYYDGKYYVTPYLDGENQVGNILTSYVEQGTFFYDNGVYGDFKEGSSSWSCFRLLSLPTVSFSTPAGAEKVWYCSGYLFAYDGSTIYYGAGRPSGTFPSTWTALVTVSNLEKVTVNSELWGYFDSDASVINVYKGIVLMQSCSVSGSISFPDSLPDASKLYYIDSAGTSLYQIHVASYDYQNGLNFLNSDKQVVAYEADMGDYIQSQACTFYDGDTALINLPTTIPSGMDFYRKIPKLYDTTQMILSVASIDIEAYTRFDTSVNAEVYMSAITTVPSRVDLSPTSLRVDNVEKLNSEWYIKNKTSLTATVTPNTESAGVKTGDIEPKTGDNTIGAITPYKVIKGETINATTAEVQNINASGEGRIGDAGNPFTAVYTEFLGNLYPVGSIYMSTRNISPASFLGGEWTPFAGGAGFWTESVPTDSSGNYIYDGSSNFNGGTESEALPNLKGTFGSENSAGFILNTTSGAFYPITQVTSYPAGTGSGQYGYYKEIGFSASNYNSSLYGDNNPVRPKSYKVYAWRRVS